VTRAFMLLAAIVFVAGALSAFLVNDTTAGRHDGPVLRRPGGRQGRDRRRRPAAFHPQ